MKLCSTWREGDEGNLSKKLTPASPHVVKFGSSGTRPMNGTCRWLVSAVRRPHRY